MSIRFRYALTFAVALSSLLPLRTGAQEGGPYDVVILGGRVVDPETGFDAVANVGIRDDRVVAVGTQSMLGNRIIDATNLVVAPGFIDPLTSVSAATMPSARYKVTDVGAVVQQRAALRHLVIERRHVDWPSTSDANPRSTITAAI